VEVDQSRSAGAHLEGAYPIELLSRADDVLVEDDFFGRGERPLFAEVDRVILSLLGAVVVPVAVVEVGDGEVGLLDAAEHLVVELLLERLGVLHPGGGVRVFRLEVGDDLGVGLIADPEVVVGADFAVEGVDLGDDSGGWRSDILGGEACR